MPKLKLFTSPGQCVTYDALPGENLGDFAERTGAPLSFGCRAAACGTCRVRVLEGAENLSTMLEAESSFLKDFAPQAHPQDRLACQTLVEGNVTLSLLNTGNHNHPEGAPQ